jgi:hypothetical protein
MSVKHIASNARGIFQRKHLELSEKATRVENALRGMNEVERFLNNVPKGMDATVATLKAGAREYATLLQNNALWDASEHHPIPLNMSNTADLFGRTIRGMLFIYGDCIYSVNGPFDPAESKVLVIDYVKRRREKAEYLVSRKDVPDAELKYERLPIPEWPAPRKLIQAL